jgi:hypothetical protein
MSSSLSVHPSYCRGRGDLQLRAIAHDYANTPLIITASDNNGEIAAVSFFLENDALTKALVAAINNTVASVKAASAKDGEGA